MMVKLVGREYITRHGPSSSADFTIDEDAAIPEKFRPRVTTWALSIPTQDSPPSEDSGGKDEHLANEVDGSSKPISEVAG